MFSTVMLRNGDIHIINYKLLFKRGQYRTICQKRFHKNMRINTLAAGDVFPGICKKCKSSYEATIKIYREHNIQFLYNKQQLKYYSLQEYHQHNLIGPMAKHIVSMKRIWPKLNRYKNLITKNEQ